jgi:hypothetical protein
MTAEFPDTSALDQEERRVLARGEFAGMDLADLEDERGRREDQLQEARAQCLPELSRVIGNRLEALRTEIERRGNW